MLTKKLACFVEVEGATIGEVGTGLMILVCAMAGDGEAEAEKLGEQEYREHFLVLLLLLHVQLGGVEL